MTFRTRRNFAASAVPRRGEIAPARPIVSSACVQLQLVRPEFSTTPRCERDAPRSPVAVTRDRWRPALRGSPPVVTVRVSLLRAPSVVSTFAHRSYSRMTLGVGPNYDDRDRGIPTTGGRHHLSAPRSRRSVMTMPYCLGVRSAQRWRPCRRCPSQLIPLARQNFESGSLVWTSSSTMSTSISGVI
jgi:hypothetical protein